MSWTQALSPLAPTGGCHPHPEVPPQLQEVHARRPEPGVRLHLVHTGKSILDETKWRLVLLMTSGGTQDWKSTSGPRSEGPEWEAKEPGWVLLRGQEEQHFGTLQGGAGSGDIPLLTP